VSCGGMRQERPPIVLENILSCIDTLWGAWSSTGGGLLLQQQPLGSSRVRSSICHTVLQTSHSMPHKPHAKQEWHNQKEAVKALLDDSPAAPDLAQVQDASLLWAGLSASSRLCCGVCCVCVVSPRTRRGPGRMAWLADLLACWLAGLLACWLSIAVPCSLYTREQFSYTHTRH
jgi:hypothetical protein